MKRPKIGLITYCVGNQGSALQCYATQQYLSEKGIDCCLFTRHERGISRILQSLEYRLGAYFKLLRFPQYWTVYRECKHPQSSNIAMMQETSDAIKQFTEKNIYSKQCSWKQLQQLGKSDEYVAFFSGSDQIWSGFWFLTNRIWFLRFCPRNKRVAWMPSFGSDNLAEYNKDIYKRYIGGYKFISVREISGQKIVHQLIGKNVPVLPDPVYLLSAEDWRKISANIEYRDKYILMFFISKPNPSVIIYAQKKASQFDAKIIWLSYDHGIDGVGVLVNGGPQEFISYIDNAELVLTDSFHASLFSIILSTPFYVFCRTDNGGSRQLSRVHNLLNKFQMKNRLVENMLIVEENSWDYKAVRKVLEEERHKVDIFFKEISNFYFGGMG